MTKLFQIQNLFPALSVLVSLGGATVAGIKGDLRQFTYFFAGAVITVAGGFKWN